MVNSKHDVKIATLLYIQTANL